jgi:hypothetical protein
VSALSIASPEYGAARGWSAGCSKAKQSSRLSLVSWEPEYHFMIHSCRAGTMRDSCESTWQSLPAGSQLLACPCF